MHPSPTRRVAARLAALVAVLGLATSARALDLGPRRLEVSGALDVRTALKLSQDLIRLNEAAQAPIQLLIVGSGGSAQGVMLVADTIKALESPVVAVVMTPVMGAGAALALVTDQLVMFPSADLALTEVEYEGIAKKDPPKPDAPPEEPAVAATREFQQKLRADSLKRFWSFIARRSGDTEASLIEAVEKRGGRVLTAQEAMTRKIAAEVVTKLGVARKVEDKTEIKATTTRNLIRTAPAPAAP
jgi:membrane-bound ClpP family serine protease